MKQPENHEQIGLLSNETTDDNNRNSSPNSSTASNSEHGIINAQPKKQSVPKDNSSQSRSSNLKPRCCTVLCDEKSLPELMIVEYPNQFYKSLCDKHNPYGPCCTTNLCIESAKNIRENHEIECCNKKCAPHALLQLVYCTPIGFAIDAVKLPLNILYSCTIGFCNTFCCRKQGA